MIHLRMQQSKGNPGSMFRARINQYQSSITKVKHVTFEAKDYFFLLFLQFFSHCGPRERLSVLPLPSSP